MNVIVIGGGPAGIVASVRAADLGARTTLITRGPFGGMAANDGPIPVRTLAHAARLMREARLLGRYGVAVGDPVLEYPRLLDRVRDVVQEVRSHSAGREQLEQAGATLYENTGTARFVDSHTIETESGLRLEGDRIILCTGGKSRMLAVPGFELTATHSDAWSLSAVPPSLLVVGAGATGVQVASIFHAFGSRIQLFEASTRILGTEDEDVSAEVATAFRERGIVVREHFGTIEHFEKTPAGVRMSFSKDGVRHSEVASVVVVAIGWLANTVGLNMSAAGVESDVRGYVSVDVHLQTSVPHVFAAGDVTGRMMFVTQAAHEGYLAASNAVCGATTSFGDRVHPVGSFTDPEYAQVGLTEAAARKAYDVVVDTVRFASTPRPIIDGRTTGFCKLIVDRASHAILGCHIVGERAVEISQVAAVAIASGMQVEMLVQIPLSFPTYTNVLDRAVLRAARQLDPDGHWPAIAAFN
jgi:dihydrolipoamide dehydrogenase